MTYEELYSIIRRTVSGNRPNADDNFNSPLINRLVLSARAFILMKYTNSGRNYQQTLVQYIRNVKLLPVETKDFGEMPPHYIGGGQIQNTLNDIAYIDGLYYYDLPSELLQWGNRRALQSVTSIDNITHCHITEENSVKVGGDPLFPNTVPIAWVNRNRLFVSTVSYGNKLGIKDAQTDLYATDKDNWPNGTELQTTDASGLTEPMVAKFVNIGGIFYDPIAVAGVTSEGPANTELSQTAINIPYEFLDMLVEQVKSAYLEAMEKTAQETTLDGRSENQALQPPI